MVLCTEKAWKRRREITTIKIKKCNVSFSVSLKSHTFDSAMSNFGIRRGSVRWSAFEIG